MSIKTEVFYTKSIKKDVDRIERGVFFSGGKIPKYAVLIAALYVEDGLEKADSVLLIADTIESAYVASGHTREFFKTVCKKKYRVIQSFVGLGQEIMELQMKMAEYMDNDTKFTKAGTHILNAEKVPIKEMVEKWEANSLARKQQQHKGWG